MLHQAGVEMHYTPDTNVRIVRVLQAVSVFLWLLAEVLRNSKRL